MIQANRISWAVRIRNGLRRLIPVEVTPPTNLPRRILSTLGYFHFRTWLAARGAVVPDGGLYQPTFSPWLGLPAFEQLYQSVRKHTMVSRDRCHILWQTLQQSIHLSGAIVECGVFRGGTALLAAKTLTVAGQSSRPLHLFDSFEGMGKAATSAESFRSGDFGRTSEVHVRRLLADYRALQMHVGFIPDTFADLELGPIAWAHIDLDLYTSIRDAVEYLYPRLVPGGCLIFDDYGFPSCPGARQAVDELFANRPEVPLCLPTGQALVVKLPSEPEASATVIRPIRR